MHVNAPNGATNGHSIPVTQDVHIVPLAREYDRAVLPFLAHAGKPAVLHAHRIILLVPDSEEARLIGTKVEKALRNVANVERYILAADRARPTAGFQGILQQVAWICRHELEAGNRVHINLSSGSKLVAFAAGLAGMAHLKPGSGSLYYVQPNGFAASLAEFEDHGLAVGLSAVEELELMPMMLPDPVQLRVLNFLQYQPDGWAEYRDLIGFLSEIADSGYGGGVTATPQQVRNWNNAVTTRMVRTILTPLAQQGLIEIVVRGRQKAAQLTRRGLLYASITGLERRHLRAPLRGKAQTVSMMSTASTLIHGRV
ncbi:MAG TPA: DUF6293 family protein [Candidatus Thermoplasmatota archaeon]|nr:DUF6293 family protein [Candidatus Thermoplasmatota archaeon]